MTDSTASRTRGKGPSTKLVKLKKPRADFPLQLHKGSRSWANKVRGKVFYFGSFDSDPKGIAALARWLDEKDDLLAGREPSTRAVDALTVADACYEYLSHHRDRRDAGEISPGTFQSLHATCVNMVHKDVLGKQRDMSDLGPIDFERLRKHLAKTRKAVALGNEMQRVGSVLK